MRSILAARKFGPGLIGEFAIRIKIAKYRTSCTCIKLVGVLANYARYAHCACGLGEIKGLNVDL